MPIDQQEQLVAAQVSRPRVLVADDDEAMCALLAVSLADGGYEVEVVRSGKEALLRLNCAKSASNMRWRTGSLRLSTQVHCACVAKALGKTRNLDYPDRRSRHRERNFSKHSEKDMGSNLSPDTQY